MKRGFLDFKPLSVAMVVGVLFVVAAAVGLLTHRSADRVREGEGSAEGLVAGSGPAQDQGGSRKASVGVPVPGRQSRTRAGTAVPPTRNNPSSAAIQSARSDFPDFKAVGYAGTSPVTEGEYAEAFVRTASGNGFRLTPNQLGEFQKTYVQPFERVSVEIAYASVAPGTPFAIAVQDGGSLKAGKTGAVVQLDDQQRLRFDFAASHNEGIHRVVVRSPDGDRKMLEFWAGPERVFAGGTPASR